MTTAAEMETMAGRLDRLAEHPDPATCHLAEAMAGLAADLRNAAEAKRTAKRTAERRRLAASQAAARNRHHS